MRIWRWETQMISCEKTSLTDNQFHKYLVGRLGWAGEAASLTDNQFHRYLVGRLG